MAPRLEIYFLPLKRPLFDRFATEYKGFGFP
jgi:hypothetical protein